MCLASLVASLRFHRAALAGINTALQNAGKPKLDAKYTPEAFADAAIAAMGGKPSLSKRNLHTRDIFTDIACWAFATGALPGFLVAAAWFAGANTGTPYTATSDDESFFLKAIYGTPPSHKVYYSATFPPGFGSAAATTIGHHVYFKDGAAHNDNPAAGKWSLNAAFADRTHILAHESRHIQQFESDGSLLAFGYNYLYEYCQAGFSYSKNSYEKEAYQVGDSVLPLMSPPIFYKIWKGVALQPKIGWPTSTTSTNGIIYFTNGFLQINPSDFPNNVSTKRYRFATKGTDAYKRFVGAQCNPNRKPLNGNSKPCKSDNAPAACDPEYIDALNKACKANIQALANNPIGWLTF